ncbi:rRNA maturation RNase YbeY [Microgenomates group bacterium RBG_19FT_COMBO_39_10]|nr:MAG: rRNA maturation RNase YbeY [Microgenomates group bacterium RBG_19FT_COMBO_39_10]
MISVLIKPTNRSPVQNNRDQKIIKSFLEKEKIDNVEVSLIFVKSQAMRQLNKHYRGIDQVTTVLTFSQQEKKEGQAFPESPRKLKILGDLIICLEEAEKKGYSLEELLVHGLKNLIKVNERQPGLSSQISSSKNLRT